MKAGLYLSGAGSLDGSDVPTAVFAREALSDLGHEIIVGARDIDQGKVVDHRTLETRDQTRNSLAEAARITRGDVEDLAEIPRDELEALVLVGGGGTTCTWTDFEQETDQFHITERLKFHIQAVFRNQNPIVCLGNAHLPVAFVLRNEVRVQFNAGSNQRITRVIESWGHELTDRDPSYDETHSITHVSGVTRESDWPRARKSIYTAIERSL